MTDEHEAAMLALCERFFDAVAAGDIEAVRAIYAPEARIWHNTDGSAQDVEQHLGVLRAATSQITGFRYEEVRRHATASGFVEQHVLRGTLPRGAELELPAVLVCTVAGGRITRVEEYFDSAGLKL